MSDRSDTTHPSQTTPLESPRVARLPRNALRSALASLVAVLAVPGFAERPGPFHSHPGAGRAGGSRRLDRLGVQASDHLTPPQPPALLGRSLRSRHCDARPSHDLARARRRTLPSVGSCRRHASQRAPTAPPPDVSAVRIEECQDGGAGGRDGGVVPGGMVVSGPRGGDVQTPCLTNF